MKSAENTFQIQGSSGTITLAPYSQYYPSHVYSDSYFTVVYNQGTVNIRKVSNGYIVTKDNKEIIITDKAKLLNYIE